MTPREAVHKAILRTLGSGVERERIIDGADIAFDLGADSLDLVEIVMWTEDNIGVGIPDDTLIGLRTVGDLIGCAERAVASPSRTDREGGV